MQDLSGYCFKNEIQILCSHLCEGVLKKIKGVFTQDDLQRRFLTQRCNIVATWFRIIATLFPHCNAVLSRVTAS